jgi:hypothetical protein
MVDTILKILTPATTYDLVTLDELKLMLGIATTDTSEDAILQVYITDYSDIISRMCNRVFAYEEVQETVRCLQPSRYYVSHWPLLETDIDSVETPSGTPIDSAMYEVEQESGKIEFTGGNQSEPILVHYSGGYNLPTAAPPALKAACVMCIREARTWAMRQAVSGIRSISHKESRVMYFDVNAALGKKVTTPMDFVQSVVDTMLYHYMRLWV